MSKVFLAATFAVLLCSCANLFEGSAKKDSDAAKLLEARKKMDKYDWTGAITQIESMSAEYQAKREIKALLASAYAGRCGLDFLTIIENLKEAGSSNLFAVLIRAFPGRTTSQADDCVEAEATIKTISAVATERTAEENLLMAIISFAKLGAITSANLDTNGNGIADDGVDPCTALSDTEAAEIATGFGNMVTSLSSITGDFLGDTDDEINSYCAVLDDPPLNGAYPLCSFINTSEVNSAAYRQGARGLVTETTGGIGVGYCANGIDLCAVGCGT